jgi:LysM repeat protein
MPARQTYESYTVQKGDTVSAIAKRYGTTVAAIAATSGLKDPNKISVGQMLSIPVATGYDPLDMDLSEVRVTATSVARGTPAGDPVAQVVNAAASWLRPPRLWVTLGVAIGLGYYLLDEPRPRRRRR